MYFSKAELNREANPNQLAVVLCGNEYREHQMLWKLFPDIDKNAETKDRIFLFRREFDKWPIFYVVSAIKPDGGGDGLWTIQSKEYNPKVHEGQRLAFKLRVNPVRSKGEKGKRGTRHDVVMDAKRNPENIGVDGKGRKPISEVVAEEGFKWLSARASNSGFLFEAGEIRADGYRQHFLSKGGKNPIRFSTLDFEGMLTVTDSVKFVKTLFCGIGPAKGFGCGLMLVRNA
jgi:CRISPR system Cascade subunit CasE